MDKGAKGISVSTALRLLMEAGELLMDCVPTFTVASRSYVAALPNREGREISRDMTFSNLLIP
jgi:hypothetical protein